MLTDEVDYQLIVHHTKKGKYYKFINLGESEYVTHPSFTWVGMSVYVHGKSYVINPQEFLIVSNILFTQTFNRWLCKHYLRVKPSDSIVATIIDSNINVHSIQDPIRITDTTFEKNI
jgi:hypothetical protein